MADIWVKTGHFNTIVTNVYPTAKQSKILHPTVSDLPFQCITDYSDTSTFIGPSHPFVCLQCHNQPSPTDPVFSRVRELMRAQSIPDWFVLESKYGSVVTVCFHSCAFSGQWQVMRLSPSIYAVASSDWECSPLAAFQCYRGQFLQSHLRGPQDRPGEGEAAPKKMSTPSVDRLLCNPSYTLFSYTPYVYECLCYLSMIVNYSEHLK